MPFGEKSIGRLAGIAFVGFLAAGAGAVRATPYLVADADSGQVLMEKDATAVWYPASLTKLMTVYVALDAVRAGKLTMDTPLVMSAHAASMQPSKMGFRPGTEVTLDNALKMLMVKSPNDVAVMIAEGISGSVEGFAGEMNAAAGRLGLHESHFVNPNGLHNPNHVSSARDMAMIARALYREFPEQSGLYDIGALQLDNQIIRNHNGLLGRYPGADGMKTGFTCPAGFNVVASASHWGRHLIVVVMGSPSAKLRTQEAADLFDRGFAMGGGSGSLESLASGAGEPPARSNICLHRSAAAAAAADDESAIESQASASGDARGGGLLGLLAGAAAAPMHTVLSDERPQFEPVRVFVGPVDGWKGPVLAARPQREGLPKEAKAYAPEGTDEDASANAEAGAPAILKGAVRTPPAPHAVKPVKHSGSAERRAAKSQAKPAAVAKSAPATTANGKNSDAQ